MAGGLLIAVTGLILLAVVLRYVFNNPLSWSEEASRVLFIWLGFLGAALGLKRGKHIGVPFVVARLSPRAQATLALLSALMALATSALLLVEGWRNARFALLQRLPLSELSMGWLYSAVPVAAALMVVYAAADARRRWQELRAEGRARGRER